MGSGHRWIAAALWAAVSFSAAGASAATYYVRPDGDDQAAGSSARAAFRTVLRAAQRLGHGDGVVIAPGRYRESVLFAERFSADGREMSIVGDEAGKQFGAAPGPVVIEPADAAGPALRFHRFRRLRVSGLTLRGTGQGIVLSQCRDVVVERSTFDGLTRGLAATGVVGLRVESCVFARCTIGLFLRGSVAVRVGHVSVAGSSSAGLVALACGQGAVRNSLLADNNTNLIADGISAAAWTSDRNVLHGPNGPWGDAPVVANVYEWSAASGQDRHSVHVVPAFADPARCDLHVARGVCWGGGQPGRNVGRPLDPPVARDRDGRAFGSRGGAVCAGAYAYGEPQPSAGWTKLGLALSAPGPRQSAAICRPDGTRVRTLLADAAGVGELWWDGLDDLGRPVPAGRYVAKTACGDVRLVDDGAMGDDGNPMGAYNCDNADRVAALPDGGFLIAAVYDEAGYPLRRYAASGQCTFAANLAEKAFAALVTVGRDVYAVVGKGAAAKLVRLRLPGHRARMANGAEGFAIFSGAEKPGGVGGLAVAGGRAYVAAAGMDVVRVIDLATGAKQADWPVAGVGDVAVDEKGTLWAVSGTDVVSLGAAGRVGRRFATGLATPRYLAVSPARLAVVDRTSARVALLKRPGGKVARTLGTARPPGAWVPVGVGHFRDPRGAAFLADGRLAVTEQARIRILWPDSGRICQEILSNFMDVAVIHPTRPEYVYCALGVFRVDPKSGAWRWLVAEPRGQVPGPDGKKRKLYLGSPATAVVLDKRPFLVYHGQGRLRMLDVSDPLRPRMALDRSGEKVLNRWAYATVAFGRAGELICGGNYKLSFHVVPFRGLDGKGNPTYDFAAARTIGPADDPSPRGMKPIAALASDRTTGDVYYLAVTARNQKMVPGWGADGTGLGRSAADGRPLWFAPSSGGNYMSVSAAHDGRRAWVLAGKSFGGQIDVFDADGLRLATGNWSWPCHYGIGFVDMRYGVQAYVRPDGKLGAYVEDDAIGRFARCRLEGAETLRKAAVAFDWKPAGAAAAEPPSAHRVAAAGLARRYVLPRAAGLKVDGDWAAWARAGVVPQIVALPVVGFRRTVPGDLWATFRQGTAIGAIAHDGRGLYACFVVADDTLHFDAAEPGRMWEFDSVELWLEEEQFGLGMTADGTPRLFKYRHHDRAGKPWRAGYALPRENVWAAKLDDLSAHPLGRQLAAVTGASMAGRAGYAVMGRIPFDEVKLVGGIAGRTGKDIAAMTGRAGEVVRVGVSFGSITAWGREQDYKVNWPAAMMFSDPTRSSPFALGR